MTQILHRVFSPRIAWLLLACPAAFSAVSAQQPTFAVASIHPTSGEVKFEHDGNTETTPGTVRMQDVSVETCIKWAYGVQYSQISGPAWIDSDKFDITAKADSPATEDQMKVMMQALLTDRFKLSFHRQDKELKAFVLTVAKGGAKVHPAAAPDAKPFHQNSANGSVVKSMTIREWGDYISGPLQMPVVDETGLPGKYDFVIDFTPYLPDAKNMGPDRPDTTSILMAAMEGELGIKMKTRKTPVDIMVIDHVDKPSAN